jgi:predicted RNase H-like nuclease
MRTDTGARVERTVGVDGCAGGWIAVSLIDGRFEGAAFFEDLTTLLTHHAAASFIAVDIPIGPPVGRARRADTEARDFLGAGASSVFPTMPREVAERADYAEANALMRSLTGKGLSKQSFALRDKILEAAEAAAWDPRLFEVHPEVSFRAMAGAPLARRKKTWAGFHARKTLLASEGIELPAHFSSSADDVGLDDVLDAAAAGWTAHRRRRCLAQTLPPLAVGGPDEPRIWY